MKRRRESRAPVDFGAADRFGVPRERRERFDRDRGAFVIEVASRPCGT
jgi:hypothetical protein